MAAAKWKEDSLALDLLKELLVYDPETGLFTRDGLIAGCFDRRYIKISINDIQYPAHRLAWLYMTGSWPKEHIDHINHNGADNSWRNLREASPAENQRNTSMNKNNVSGTKGVHLNNRDGKWYATIRAGGKRIFLGSYVDIDDAIRARKAGEKDYGYHENHGK